MQQLPLPDTEVSSATTTTAATLRQERWDANKARKNSRTVNTDTVTSKGSPNLKTLSSVGILIIIFPLRFSAASHCFYIKYMFF